MISTEQEARILELHAKGVSIPGIAKLMRRARGTVSRIVELGRVRTPEERDYWHGSGAPTPPRVSEETIAEITREIREVGFEDRHGIWHGPWTEAEYYRREHGIPKAPWAVPTIPSQVNLNLDSLSEPGTLEIGDT